MPNMDHITVMEAETMAQIPMDGAALGEIMMRGNSVMKGYYKNPRATNEAFRGGYFHTRRHRENSTPIPTSRSPTAPRTSSISGGENVSSVEVEGVLMHHPAVLLSAVVAKPDEKWGEVPCAFLELKEGASVTEDEDHRLRPPAAGRLQDAETCRLYRTAQDLDRQDPEIRAPQAGR